MKKSHVTGIVAIVLAVIASGVWYLYARSQSARNNLPSPSVQSQPQSQSDSCVADGMIKSVPGPWKSTLYLLCVPFSSSNVVFDDPRTLDSFADGGQFQVILRPTALPVSARGCSSVIARMAWTDPASDAAQADIVV